MTAIHLTLKSSLEVWWALLLCTVKKYSDPIVKCWQVADLSGLSSEYHAFPFQVFSTKKQRKWCSYLPVRRFNHRSCWQSHFCGDGFYGYNLPGTNIGQTCNIEGDCGVWTYVLENASPCLKLHLTGLSALRIVQERTFAALVFNFLLFCGQRDGPQCYFNFVCSRQGDLFN